MKKVGVTGGIGSGKTTICRIFAILGIPIYNADLSARKLMDTNCVLSKKLIEVFGNEIYQSSGAVNREFLAQLIFSDVSKLTTINSLVHPFVMDDFNEWAKKQTNSYVIMEAAILFDSGAYRQMDVVINVSASENIRIKRVMRRDGCTLEQVVSRIKNQWTDEERNQKSDIIIDNEDGQRVLEQILGIHNQLISS